MVLELVGAFLEREVVLDGPAGIFHLLVLSRTDGGDNQPEGAQDRNE
jgi:hypothetical protein